MLAVSTLQFTHLQFTQMCSKQALAGADYLRR
jgi:hypothetical protein